MAALVLQVLGALVATFVIYLIIIAILPGLSAPPQRLQRMKPPPEPEPPSASLRTDVQFQVDGVAISAWLYRPQPHSGPLPCIVMAHGLGGTRDMGLDYYARRFQAEGFAVLVFDYRHFGASAGEPRQLVWIPHQLADWTAAIAFARGLPDVDPARIGLWGASLAGGHVIACAAKDHQIACAVAMCPGVDGRAAAHLAFHRAGWRSVALIMHAQRDLVRSWLGLSPHRIPIVGEPGTVALMTTPDAASAFAELAPDSFVNEACARIVLRADKYRPVTRAGRVRCPILLQVCENDALTPVSAAEETARRLGVYGTVLRYPIGHFDIYFGAHRERSADDQLAFFTQHLR
jgi:dienelactone hydrolase